MLRRWGGASWSSHHWTSGTPGQGEQYHFGDDAVFARPLPDGKNWIVGTTKGVIRFIERTAGKAPVERWSVQAGHGLVWRLEVSADGRMLATLAGDTLKLWDITGRKPALRDTLYKGNEALHLGFSPDNRMLALSAGYTTTVWDVRELRPRQLTKWEGDSAGRSLALSFSPDGRTLAAATEEGGKVVLRDPETGTIRKEWQLPGKIRWVGYAPDGRHLLTVNGNGTGYILRLATADGKPYVPPPKADVR